MRKLKLNVHTLRVESFGVSLASGSPSGTVRGNSESNYLCSEMKGCTAEETCAATDCQPSCDPCSSVECM